LEVANPPDPNRASKCFQKAFELDATQAGAAKRLAESFAEEREWDLVEVVARRTIEGEGGNEQITPKHLPVNSWAWKALGVVELVCFPRALILNRSDLSSSRIAKITLPRSSLSKSPFAESRMTKLAGSDWAKRTLGLADTQRR
jgi:hypothetical protein